MYAQLCLRLNEFTPNFEEAGSQTTTFRKLLLHKCHEEFEKRKKANAVLEKSDGVSAEEKEQSIITKWKMLGNIKFVGELFKLDMLHEKIIHSCVKELLEKKRHQSTEDTCKSLECLCYFLTTVGVKLDTEKAKGWMDAYFERIEGLSDNKDLPPRIRFMLQDLVDLRKNKWVPRRSHPESSPRPIYKIHQEAYEESRDPSSQSYSRRSPSNASPPQHNGSHPYPGPHPPHDIGPHPLHDIGPRPPRDFGPRPPHDIGLHYRQPPPHGPHPQYYGPPPHRMIAPGPHPQHLIGHGPPPQHMINHGPHPQHYGPHVDIHSIQSTPEFRGSSSSSYPPLLASQPPLADTSEKAATKGKKHRKSPASKSTESVSLRPSVASFKPGTKLRPSPKSSPPQDHTPAAKPSPSSVHTPAPRTRDDSSDEDDHRRSSGSVTPQAPPPLGPPFPSAPFHPMPPAPGYPPHRFPGMVPPMPQPGPMLYAPSVPPPPPSGPPMGPPPPFLMHHQQYHDGFQRGVPPPGVYPDDPSRAMYTLPPRPSLAYGGAVPPWVDPVSHGVRMGQAADHPDRSDQSGTRGDKAGSHGDKAGSPAPNVPKILSRSPKTEASKMEAAKKVEDTEKIVTMALEHFLKTIDFQATINDLKVEGINKSTMCTLLVTKTLEKSEDERTHVSSLLNKLVQANVVTPNHLCQAFNNIMVSVADYVVIVPQAKVYLAGFMARAISMGILTLADVCPAFNQGEHHPMALVVLQALSSLMGENLLQQKFQESGLKISALLPSPLRSHASIIELLDAKGIGYLYPLRKTQSELSGVMRKDPTPAAIYKWIKSNVPASLHSNTDFIMLLTRCVLDHVTHGSTPPVTTDMAQQPTKEQVAKEKDLMTSLKIVIQKLVAGNVSLQISVLYATQVFCHDSNFPKGLLLRLFRYWYDLDVVDEDAFFKWREDISQEHPGKEKALFQVHQWLVWLAEADEESEGEKD